MKRADVQVIREFIADIDRLDYAGQPDWDVLIRPTGRLCDWVQSIARMRLDGEDDGAGGLFVMENDDAWSTVHGLVTDARDLVGATESGPVATTYSRDQISDALNRAAEQILDHTGGEFPTDLINLMVNASMHQLDHPDDSLIQAIEANYETDPAEVLGWVLDG